MDRRERYDDPEESLRMAFDGQQSKLWTALPGIIQSFDSSAMTAVVQPAISGRLRQQDGTTVDFPLPLLLDCPVVFPGGGGCTLTFPIKAGDECLVVFASRCIDSWWYYGGVQGQAELRMHDLSDGFVIPGPRSKPRTFSVSTSTAQLRTDDGSAYVELNPTNHQIHAQTSGDIVANAGGSLTATASTSATITAPTITLNGNVVINGNLSQGAGAGTGAAQLIGPLTVTNDVTAAGKSLQHHTHSGVQPGSGNTGQPV